MLGNAMQRTISILYTLMREIIMNYGTCKSIPHFSKD